MTKKNKIGVDSLSCLYVTFVDGNQRTFYSRDWDSDTQVKLNPEKGIQRLKRLADNYMKMGRLSSALLKDLKTQTKIKSWEI